MRQFLVVCLLLVGCGPNFTGVWTGPSTLTGRCGTQTNSSSGSVTWALIENGPTLSITPEGGTCGSFTADMAGNIATLRHKICPGGDITSAFTGGTLTLGANDLLSLDIDASAGACVSNLKGQLSRK